MSGLPIHASVQAGAKGESVGRAAEAREEMSSPASEMRGLIERFVTDEASLDRSFPVEYSPQRTERRTRFLMDWMAALKPVKFDSLNLDGHVDYLLFKNHLDYALRRLDLKAKAQRETAALVPFATVITNLEETRRRMEGLDPSKAADLLNTLNHQIGDLHKTVDAGFKVKKTVANRAAHTVESLQRSLKAWFDFYNGYDPLFSWWVREPYKTVDASLSSYAAVIKEKLVGIRPGDTDTIVGDPIGRDALMAELAHEMIPYTPDELVAIANREFSWCETEMKKASAEMGFGDDWHKALEKVKTLYVEPGKQPAMIRDLAQEAIKYVEDHDLVTVPPLAKETWRMEMMSPERQKVNPFFLGGESIIVSFPTNTMPHEQKMMSMRGNNVHFARATVHHELIPGHHLQLFMLDRYRTWRREFETSFWIEGWALYWEMLLWDRGFARSPEDRVGMLFWRMHRCARIIFSLSFHLEKMTPKECIDFLVKRVGHERDNAAAEVRRSFSGDYSPLYQCAYMLGGLQIRALHHDLVDSGKMTDRAFHDAILKQSAIPIELIRAALTNAPPKSDFKSVWRFYDHD